MVEIRLGICAAYGGRHIWAYGKEGHKEAHGQWQPHTGHNCAADHVMNWLNRTRIFGIRPWERQITLWFTDFPHAPGTLVFHIHLGGVVYEGMLREANVKLPTPPALFTPVALPAAVPQSTYTIPPQPHPSLIPMYGPNIAPANARQW